MGLTKQNSGEGCRLSMNKFRIKDKFFKSR